MYLVAKSYQDLPQIGPSFELNRKTYVTVRTRSGAEKAVRVYSQQEYDRMYPTKTAPRSYNAKHALGFDKGYITLFRGPVDLYPEWFSASKARYHGTWGWYLASTDETPITLPPSITPVRLTWEEASINDAIKPTPALREVVDTLLYSSCPSTFQGSIGDRLELTLTVKHTYSRETTYGHTTTHIFEDQEQNQYVWVTAAKQWGVGETHTLRGTVKEHKTYKNQQQTVLTRCIER